MTPNVRRILVPFDFSDCSKAALDYAAFLAGTFGATVTVFHVIEPIPLRIADNLIVSDTPETVAEQAWRIAREETENAVATLEARNLAVTWEVEMGTAWERILARAGSADLVVMGTHGRTGLSRLLMGSVTDNVVQRALVPVLTIRAAAREPAAKTGEASHTLTPVTGE